MKQPVALFDLDGVILDTETQYSDFWNGIGRSYYPEMPQFANQIKGQTGKYIFSHYFTQEGAKERVLAELVEFEKQMTYDFVPGAEHFLMELKRQQVPCAVVTSSDQKKMSRVFAAHPSFKDLFSHIFTAEDFTRSKPDPDCYLKGASFFQVPVGQCFVFEDSINGLKAGRNAGMTVIGLATTFPESEIQSLCDVMIPDFSCFNYDTFCTLFSRLNGKP